MRVGEYKDSQSWLVSSPHHLARPSHIRLSSLGVNLGHVNEGL